MRTGGARAKGQTGTEYMLVVSVIVIAVVGAAYVFVPSFSAGVQDLGNDVRQILAMGDVGGVGRGGNAPSVSGAMTVNGGFANNTMGPGFGTPGNNTVNGGPMMHNGSSNPPLGAPVNAPASTSP